jgi:serine protease Do
MKTRIKLIFLLSLAILALGAGVFFLSSPQKVSAQGKGGGCCSGEVCSGFRNLEEAFVKVAAQIKPAVVNISTVRKAKKNFPYQFREGDPFEEFFRRFFGEREPLPEMRSLGSGVIIDEKGYVLTNCHVIEGADEITVKLSDERKYKGKILGKDKETDLAVIQIKSKKRKKFPVAKLGDSDQVKVGQWVLAIGNPFGLERTVTAGIVSATGRVIGASYYDYLIQTDASINRGNSGGPLVNLAGEVIGINTAITSPTGGSVGIGFAVPINIAKDILSDLIEHGKAIRGCLGVGIQNLTPELAEKFGLSEDQKGVVVNDVFKGYPAEKAGFKREDVIIEFDGKKIENKKELSLLVARTRVGKKVKVIVIRNKKKITLTPTIAKMPKDFHRLGGKVLPRVEEKFGLEVEEITKELAEELDLKDTQGVVIRRVVPFSPASEAGFRKYDVIKEIEEIKIKGLSDYEKALEKVEGKESILFLVERAGHTLYLVLKIEEIEEEE